MKTRVLAAMLAAGILLCSCDSSSNGGVSTADSNPSAEVTQESTAEHVSSETVAIEGEYYSLKPYTTRGTGPEKPDKPTDSTYFEAYIHTEPETMHITEIIDTSVQDKVNAWIDKARGELEESMKSQYDSFSPEERTSFDGFDGPVVSTSCKNGYLFVDLRLEYGYEDDIYGYLYVLHDARAAIFDLYTGECPEFSDLFFKDVDYISVLNKLVEEEISRPQMMDAFTTVSIPMKREFAGITENGTILAPDKVLFPRNNPYFPVGISIWISDNDLYHENSLLGVARSMEGLLSCEVSEWEWRNYVDPSGLEYEEYTSVKNIVLTGIIKSSTALDEEQIRRINELSYSIADNAEAEEFLRKMTAKGFDSPMYDEEEGWFNGFVQYTNVYPKQKLVEIVISEYMSGMGGYTLCYDLDTLEPMSTEDVVERIMGSDWQTTGCTSEESNYTSPIDFDFIRNNIDKMTVTGFYIPEDEYYDYRSVWLALVDDEGVKHCDINIKEIE